MRLFNIHKVRDVSDDETNVMSPSRGWIIVLEDSGVYYGWSDHRYKKLSLGKWIEFAGNNRIVESPIAPIGEVKSYPNGFHIIFSQWAGKRELGIDGDDLNYAQSLVPKWAALKHKKKMAVEVLKVDLRGITHVGEMLTSDHGPGYRGCVCQEIFIRD